MPKTKMITLKYEKQEGKDAQDDLQTEDYMRYIMRGITNVDQMMGGDHPGIKDRSDQHRKDKQIHKPVKGFLPEWFGGGKKQR